MSGKRMFEALVACCVAITELSCGTTKDCCTENTKSDAVYDVQQDTGGEVAADDPCGLVLNPNCAPDACKIGDGTTGLCRLTASDLCECSAGGEICETCESDLECGPGLHCLDDDGDTATSKVCSRVCSLAAMCPAGTECDSTTNICACDKCKNLSEAQCEQTECDDHNPLTTNDRCVWVVGPDTDPGSCECGGDVPELSCDMEDCKTDSDCVLWTGGRLNHCTDIGSDGTGRCTVECAEADDCPSPFSLCVNEECICPCKDPELLTVTLTCSPLHTSALSCMTATAGSLPICEDTDYDGNGECTDMCHANKDCPDGLVCDLSYGEGIFWLPDRHGLCVCPDLANHCDLDMNPDCRADPCVISTGGFGRCILDENGCYCGETDALCEACEVDADCGPGLYCLDDDADATTAKTCTMYCGAIVGDDEMYDCPDGTRCLLTVEDKVCTCNRTPVNLQCGYECTTGTDCVEWTEGLLDQCADIDTSGTGRCTRTCVGVADCPEPYSMCVAGTCQCPCDKEVACSELHTSSLACGVVTGGAMWQCDDVDRDGTGECTSWCHLDVECPAGMACDRRLAPALGWGLCACTGVEDASPCGTEINPNCQAVACNDGDPSNYNDRCDLVTVGETTSCECVGEVHPASPCADAEEKEDCFLSDLTPGTCMNGNAGLTCELVDAKFCQICDLTSATCEIGTFCADDDGLSVTPTVCTRTCSTDDDCEVDSFCNPSNGLCVCDRCKDGINEECIEQPCLTDDDLPMPGICRLDNGVCECGEVETDPEDQNCELLTDPLAYCVASSNGSNIVDGVGAAYEIPFVQASGLWAWGPAVTTWAPLMSACSGAQWIWRDASSWDRAVPSPQCASFATRFEISNNYPSERCMVLTADDTARVYVDGVLRGVHAGPPAGSWSSLTSIDLVDLAVGIHDLKIETCSTVPRYAGLLYNLLVR